MSRTKKDENQIEIENKIDEKSKKTSAETKKKVDEKDPARIKANKIIEQAKGSGKITYGELANQLEDISPDQIDKVFDVFEELGVDVLKDDSDEEEPNIEDLEEVLNLNPFL